MSVDLRVDWCNYEAAKYAVEKWHYKHKMPAGKCVYLGAWEDGVFIGAIVWGMGQGDCTNGARYGLPRSHAMAELARVALTKHVSPVSQIVALAIKKLKRQSPGLRCLISMADPAQGHHGGIYQAGNWIYTGLTKPDVMNFSRGEWVLHRTATQRGSTAGLPSRKLPSKYRYLYPLDREMRKRLAEFSLPYPCGQSVEGDTSGNPPEEAGSIPAGRF